MKLCWLLTCLSTALLAEAHNKCHTSELDLCLLPVMLNLRRNPVPENVKALHKMCEQMDKMWKCVDNYMEKCMADLHYMALNLMLEEPRMVQREMCSDGSKFQKDYLKLAQCFSDTFDRLHPVCNKNFESIVYQVTGDDIEARIPAGCCYFNKARECVFDGMEKSCGKESFPVMNKSLRISGMNYINNFCSSYDPSSKICMDVLNRNVTSPSEEYSYLARFITMMKYSN